MDSIDTPRLVYLVLLVAVIAGYFFVENRRNLSKSMQQAAVWGLIFVGFIAGYGMWNDLKSTVSPGQMVFGEEGRIEIPRQRDGHYYLAVDIDGTEIDFVVDTGATDMVLSTRDATRAGIDVDALAYTQTAYTANGPVQSAPVRLGEVRIGDIVDHNVWASVNGGDLGVSLLGMTYLERFARIEISNGKLILTR